MKKAAIKQTSCVACGECVKHCFKGALSIFKGCYACVDESKCVGCGQCVKACGASIISIKEVV